MKFIKKLLSKTPKLGKTIRNVGGVLLGGTAASFSFPEIPESYIQILTIVYAVVLVFKGQYSTAEDVINEAKEIDKD